MVRKDTVKELQSLNAQEVAEKVNGWRKELFGLRLSAATNPVKDLSQFKKLRKNIARGLTVLSQLNNAS